MYTPLLPQFRQRLAALGRHTLGLRQHKPSHLDGLFQRLLPTYLLSSSDHGPGSRQRIFSTRRTFFGFLYQVLNPLCSCREMVRQFQALSDASDARPVDDNNSAYCQARKRLPWDILPRLRCAVAAQAQQTQERWRGLRVKVIDATTISMPDTVKLQRSYPQPSAQKPGCGFPLLKLVGVFCLSSGALLDYAKGNKHKHELSLFQSLLDSFKASDLALADRGFSAYTLLGLLLLRSAHGLFRLHHARPSDLRKGKRLGKNDRLMLWFKPARKPPYLPKGLWRLVAPQLSVRIIRRCLAVPGFRTKSVTLVTTLLDPQAYPADELAALYIQRWRVELYFRDIKTSMGMDVLRCKSPQMVHKELEMFFIAYNLIRCLMVEAAALSQSPLPRLSFKGTIDSVRQFSLAMAHARSRKKRRNLETRLLETIASDRIPDRPGRREPRALKRRLKPFPILTGSRHQYKEIPHRNHYRKSQHPNLRRPI